mgnify:CR=1 FL=1
MSENARWIFIPIDVIHIIAIATLAGMQWYVKWFHNWTRWRCGTIVVTHLNYMYRCLLHTWFDVFTPNEREKERQDNFVCCQPSFHLCRIFNFNFAACSLDVCAWWRKECFIRDVNLLLTFENFFFSFILCDFLPFFIAT